MEATSPGCNPTAQQTSKQRFHFAEENYCCDVAMWIYKLFLGLFIICCCGKFGWKAFYNCSYSHMAPWHLLIGWSWCWMFALREEERLANMIYQRDFLSAVVHRLCSSTVSIFMSYVKTFILLQKGLSTFAILSVRTQSWKHFLSWLFLRKRQIRSWTAIKIDAFSIIDNPSEAF